MRSGFERTVAAQLKKAGVKFTYESLKVPYVINHNYNPDFMLDNGVIIEVKGYFRAGDVAKMRAVKAQNPDLDIRFLFSDGDKRIPGQKTTHGAWADRHGFPWASGVVPKEWYE